MVVLILQITTLCLFLTFQSNAQTTALTFRPVAAEYSSALDRIVMISGNPNLLRIYNPSTQAETTVALSKAPVSLSIGPSGTYAAVGHDGLISYVNLNTATVEKTFIHTEIAQNVVLGAEYVYVVPAYSGSATSIAIASGSATATGFNYRSGGRLHPSGKAIYGTRDGVSPNDIERYDVSTGPVTAHTDSPYHGDYSICGPIWFSSSGQRIYTGCGTVFRYSEMSSLDMTYIASLPGPTGVAALSDSANANRVAAILGSYYYSTSNDSEVRLYRSDSLSYIGRLTLPDFQGGASSYKAHGKYVFFNNEGKVLYVIMQADSTSGLLNDYAIQTYNLANPPPCVSIFNAANSTAIAAGGLATTGITAAAPCIYQLTTSAPWIVLIDGAFGSGNGTLTYLTRPNLTASTRTATISMGGQSLNVTQDPAPATPSALNRLAYNVTDAEYSKGLDRLIFVAASPDELHIYNTATQADQLVALPLRPLSVSVRPDGLYAAVGHEGRISYVNLQTAAIENSFSVPADVSDLVLAPNGFIYAFPQRDWSDIYSVEIATAKVSPASAIYNGRVARLHPNFNWLYVGGNWTSKWDISTGVAKLSSSISTYTANTCGNLWITEDGNRILTSCATVFRSSNVAAEDWASNGSFAEAQAVRWAAHSSTHRSTVLIPNTTYPGPNNADTELQTYGDDALAFSGRLAFPKFPAGNNLYTSHGRFVFWDANASKLITILRADSTAGLLSEDAVYVVSPGTPGCTVTLGSQSVNAAGSGGLGQFPVSAGDGCVWDAKSSAAWLTVTKGGFSFGPGSVSYSIAANSTSSSRTATITIGNQTFTVNQSGNSGAITLNPTSAAIAGAGGSGTITVNSTGGSFDWTAISNADWITITSGASGSGSGQVAYQAAANPKTTSRSGTISIGGQTVTLAQAGVVGSVTLNPTSATVGAGPNTGTIQVTANASDYMWSAVSNVSWIQVSSGTITGNGYVNYLLQNNTGTTSRTGTITIGDKTFTVTQEAPIIFTINPTSASFGPAGGTGTITITSSSTTNAWLAVPTVDWITITSGQSGTGSGSVSYKVAAGTVTGTRTGSIYISGVASTTFPIVQAVTAPTTTGPLRFIPITPCRLADTRETGYPAGAGAPFMTGGQERTFPIQNGRCGPLTGAAAYSLNITVVPRGPLAYLTVWPTGQPRPLVSTLNSFDGRIKANAAIVPAGTGGNIQVYVNDATDVILDINGYFVSTTNTEGLAFYPVTPCRIADTRDANGALGGPQIAAGQTRNFPVTSANCGVPSTAKAYSLNMTAVPTKPLGYLTTWPTGSAQPFVSTLNSPTGTVVANAAIVPAGTGGNVSVYATDATDVVIDINGYFAPPGGTGALSFYPVTPCRISDTRNAASTFGGPAHAADQTRDYAVASSGCGLPTTAKAYSLNATVLPSGYLGYLTVWPSGGARPLVSTLNSFDGSVVSNALLVPANTAGAISTYTTNVTHLILDTNGYFAP